MACFAARGGHGANLEPERTALAADFSVGNPDLSDRRRAWGGFKWSPKVAGDCTQLTSARTCAGTIAAFLFARTGPGLRRRPRWTLEFGVWRTGTS